jgi:hypothetical protein
MFNQQIRLKETSPAVASIHKFMRDKAGDKSTKLVPGRPEPQPNGSEISMAGFSGVDLYKTFLQHNLLPLNNPHREECGRMLKYW